MNIWELIKKNKNYLLSFENKNIEKKYLSKITEKLNKEKLVIISGFNWVWKISYISQLIQKSNYKNSFLYFNKELDLENNIKNKNDLLSLIDSFWKENNLKIIILENIYHIENIKSCISTLYQKWYKMIIIWNSIKVGNKPEIEILEPRKTYFQYFWYNKEEQKKDLDRKNIIKNKATAIIYKEIFDICSIKHFDLYNYSLIFLAKYNKLDSIRWLHKQIEKIISFSLNSFYEYIKYSLQAKILKQVFLYDFKKEKAIESKTKFYFSDIDFRNSLYNFELDENILKENFLFLELEKRWFNIFSWKNWSYDFCFFAKKKVSTWILEESLFIDFCNTTNKQEFKKQLNKLLKIPNPKNTISKKYLILDSLEKLSIKKTKYENLEILNFNELLKKIYFFQ